MVGYGVGVGTKFDRRGVVSGGVVPIPPVGFVWQLDDDGQYLLDDDGTLRMEEA